MSNTQKFAEIDKIAEGVYKINEKEEIKIKNGIITGSDISVMRDADNPFFEKNPQLKKWKETLRALPKKEQEEYTQEKKAQPLTPEAQKTQENKVDDEIIPPNTERLSFLLDDKYFKKPKNQKTRELAKSRHQVQKI